MTELLSKVSTLTTQVCHRALHHVSASSSCRASCPFHRLPLRLQCLLLLRLLLHLHHQRPINMAKMLPPPSFQRLVALDFTIGVELENTSDSSLSSLPEHCRQRLRFLQTSFMRPLEHTRATTSFAQRVLKKFTRAKKNSTCSREATWLWSLISSQDWSLFSITWSCWREGFCHGP